MDISQITLVVGIVLIVAVSIAGYLYSRKRSTSKQLPTSAAITKDVMDQILGQAIKAVEESDTVAKPKKKRKYYPKKPKTQA